MSWDDGDEFREAEERRKREAAFAAPTGYAATYRTEDGKTKLKPEVATALDAWGWREPNWPTRNDSEVNAFISGWEAAMRHNK